MRAAKKELKELKLTNIRFIHERGKKTCKFSLEPENLSFDELIILTECLYDILSENRKPFLLT